MNRKYTIRFRDLSPKAANALEKMVREFVEFMPKRIKMDGATYKKEKA